MSRRALLLIVFALAACDGTKAQIGKTVRDYDDALVLAFRTGDLSSLKSVAVEKEVSKVAALVDLKRAAGLVLESEITSFETESVERVGADGATVTTSETWKYHDRAVRPGIPPGRTFLSKMTMQYSLERKDGVWRVAQVRTLFNDFLEPKGFRVEKSAHGTEPSR